MPTLGILDKSGLLTGYRKCGEKAWVTKPGQVAMPDDPDLQLDRYKWDGTTFVPLQPAGAAVALPEHGEPNNYPLGSHDRAAIALGLLSLDRASLAGSGGALDADARSWAETQLKIFGGGDKL